MDSESYKKVVKNAIQSEIDAKNFYLNVSKRIKDSFLQNQFKDFAEEEARHERILTALLDKGQITTSTFHASQDFKISETLAMPEVSDDMDLKDAIAIAMKNEEIAMQNYQSLAEDCDDPGLKEVFTGLAAMEQGHKFKLEESFVDIAYPEVW